MKVNNKSIYMGDTLKGERRQEELNKNTDSASSKSFFAGGLFQNQDNYLAHKNAAQKKALKVITDARKVEIDLDDGNRKRRSEISRLQEDNEFLYNEIKYYQEQINKAKEVYGVTEDSQEQKDLELILKAGKAEDPHSIVRLTKEERERYSQLEPMTDYQQMALTFHSLISHYEGMMEDNSNEVKGLEGANRAVENERLKTHKMVDAQHKYDKLVEEAAKAAALLLVGEARDHIDEELKEEVEAAREKAEKEKEEEEKIEAAQEESETKEELAEAVREEAGAMTGEMVERESAFDDIKTELKKIINEEKILEEDLKGVAVNKIC